MDPNTNFNPQLEDFIPIYSLTSSSDKNNTVLWQEYTIPPPTYGFTVSPNAQPPIAKHSPDILEVRRGSSSTRPGRPNRKRYNTQIASATVTRCQSSKTKQGREEAEKKVTSGSKLHATVNEATPASASSFDYDRDESMRTRMRSRDASKEYCSQKSENVRKLKSLEVEMEQIHRESTNRVADLTLEVYSLKMELLQHTECNCFLIRNYIVNEAHRYIDE